MQTWHELPTLADARGAAASAGREIRAVRAEVQKELEALRVAGQIGSSLQAEVEIRAGGDALRRCSQRCGDDLRFVLITSQATRGAGRRRRRAAIVATPSAHAKCERCWHYRADVGADPAHPELCGRCVANLYGAGETRRVPDRRCVAARAVARWSRRVIVVLDQLDQVRVVPARSRSGERDRGHRRSSTSCWCYNTGAAFSFLAGAAGWQRGFFIAIALAAIGVDRLAAARATRGERLFCARAGADPGRRGRQCDRPHAARARWSISSMFHCGRLALAGVQRRRLRHHRAARCC